MSQEASQNPFIVLMEAELAGQQRIVFILMMPIRGMKPDRNQPFFFACTELSYMNICRNVP